MIQPESRIHLLHGLVSLVSSATSNKTIAFSLPYYYHMRFGSFFCFPSSFVEIWFVEMFNIIFTYRIKETIRFSIYEFLT